MDALWLKSVHGELIISPDNISYVEITHDAHGAVKEYVIRLINPLAIGSKELRVPPTTPGVQKWLERWANVTAA
jgi:hypothetical protein